MLPKQNILLSGGPPRVQLERFLYHQNSAVLWNQPPTADQIGASDVLNCSAWKNWGYASAGSAGNLLQATGANQPLLPSTDSVPKAWLPGVVGDYLSTPSRAALNVAGNLVLIWGGRLANWASAVSLTGLIGKYNRNAVDKRQYQLWINGTTGYPHLNISSDGTVGNTSQFVADAAPGFSAWQYGFVRGDYDSVAGTVTFYKALSQNGPWVQLGNVISATPRAIFAGDANLIIGATDEGASDLANMQPYYACVKSGTYAGGTVVSEYSASDAPETSTNGATFVSSTTGETYTLVSAGAKPAMLCRSPMMLGDGTTSFMQTGALTINPPYTIISVEKALTWTSGDVSFDGRTANSFAAQQITGTPQMRIHDGSADSATISPTLGAFNIITASQSAAGALSLQLNQGTPVTATMSATALAGLTSFADGAGANFWNGIKKEKLVFSEVLSASKLQRVQSLLRQLHSTP